MIGPTTVNTLKVLAALIRRNLSEGRRVREVTDDAMTIVKRNFAVCHIADQHGVALHLIEMNPLGKLAAGASQPRATFEELHADKPAALAEAIEALAAGLSAGTETPDHQATEVSLG